MSDKMRVLDEWQWGECGRYRLRREEDGRYFLEEDTTPLKDVRPHWARIVTARALDILCIRLAERGMLPGEGE